MTIFLTICINETLIKSRCAVPLEAWNRSNGLSTIFSNLRKLVLRRSCHKHCIFWLLLASTRIVLNAKWWMAYVDKLCHDFHLEIYIDSCVWLNLLELVRLPTNQISSLEFILKLPKTVCNKVFNLMKKKKKKKNEWSCWLESCHQTRDDKINIFFWYACSTIVLFSRAANGERLCLTMTSFRTKYT